MNTVKLMAIIEAERIKLKLHKTAFCASCGISTTYYNNLIAGKSNPSFNIAVDMLNKVDLSLIVGKIY